MPQSNNILIELLNINKCEDAPSTGIDNIVWIVNFICYYHYLSLIIIIYIYIFIVYRSLL